MKIKLIFSPQLAQYLLYHGSSIVELKHSAINETVFIFKYEDNIDKLIKEGMNSRAA